MSYFFRITASIFNVLCQRFTHFFRFCVWRCLVHRTVTVLPNHNAVDVGLLQYIPVSGNGNIIAFIDRNIYDAKPLGFAYTSQFMSSKRRNTDS